PPPAAAASRAATCRQAPTTVLVADRTRSTSLCIATRKASTIRAARMAPMIPSGPAIIQHKGLQSISAGPWSEWAS
ncbi:hypothetical protein OC844_008003, partial [Tilletia horrida]